MTNNAKKDAGDAPPMLDAEDVWRVQDVQTGRNVRRPRDKASDAAVVPGFTGTGPSGSQGGRALHGVAPDDLPVDQRGEEAEEE